MLPDQSKVVVTGMGCISGLGGGVATNWRRLLAGDGAIRPPECEAGVADEVALPAATVATDDVAAALSGEQLQPLGKLDPLSRFALAATLEAVAQAGLRGHPVLSRRTAVVLGCGSGGNAALDASYQRIYGRGTNSVHPQTISSSMVSAPASHVAMLLAIHGPAFVVASACASSGHALGEAMHMIRAGRVDVAIAGGAEACLNHGSRAAWASLGACSPDTCRPFSAGRRGMVLGEGAAMLVLESAAHAAARGAPVLAHLAGYGASSDAAHITAPDRTGIALAIEAALADAAVAHDEPALVAAHGTGTLLNDVAEAAALRQVYGAALAQHTVIATKSAHGHLIGGAGAIGFVLGLTALAQGMAPPVLNHLGRDPACDLPLALVPTPTSARVLVANSFAFGGLNAVLVGRLAA